MRVFFAAPAATRGPTAVGSRLFAIEVLRGVASSWVVLFHSLSAYPVQTLHPILQVVHRLSGHGWMGVNIFFAISGWCVAERVATGHRRGEAPGVFLWERVLRIYPTYWVALAATFALRLATLPFNATHAGNLLPDGTRGWAADLLLLNPYLGVPATLIVSWSLVYELGFYVLAAIGLFLLRRGLSARVLVVLGILLCLWPRMGYQLRAAYAIDLWPDFLAGVLAWFAARSQQPGKAAIGSIGLGLLALLTLAWTDGDREAGRIVALATAVILWGLSGHDSAVFNRPALRSFAWVGGFSYSLYLIHLSLLSPAMNLSARLVSPQRFAFCLLWLVAVILAMAGGWCLHRMAEAPIERWRKIRWRRPLVPGTAVQSSA